MSSADFVRSRARRGGARPWLLIGLVAVAAAVGAPKAGRALVVEDRFDHADTAIVLSGSPVVRSLAAAQLYRAGRVAEILVIPEPPEPGREKLIALGLLDAAQAPISARILRASGVPAAKIRFLPAPVDGTINEARQVRAFLAGRYPAKLVIVTSKFAARRARFIFRRLFAAQHVEVLAYPSPDDPFEPDRWWTQPRTALTVVTEYQKLVSNGVTLLWAR